MSRRSLEKWLSGLVPLLLGLPTPATAARAPEGPTAGGMQLWVARYDGPTSTSDDGATEIAVSPDGSMVFVTGESSWAHLQNDDYFTAAYDAASGSMVWGRRYSGPAGDDDEALSLAVSPDGSRVFVTGYSTGTTSGLDWVTLGYDAATGSQLWVRRFNGPGNGSVVAHSIAVSPDGSSVFVSGYLTGPTSGTDWSTRAYAAATGARIWAQRVNGPGNASDEANSIAVSADGSKVFVTGFVTGTSSHYATMAYDGETGKPLWLRGAKRVGGSARDIAVSPDGSRVFVTGFGGVNGDYVTLAYGAATGARLWKMHYSVGPDDLAYSIAVSPDGSRVFVTGSSEDAQSVAFATVGYDASSGYQLWVDRLESKFGVAVGYSVAVSPDGSRVFATGFASTQYSFAHYATLAMDAVTGASVWYSTYEGLENEAGSVVVSPDGSRVFVTGRAQGDYATVAYSA